MADPEVMTRWMEAAREYAERFGDGFPLMQFDGGLEEAVAEIRRCIEAGEPYQPEEGVVY